MMEFNGAPGATPAHGVWKYVGNQVFEGTWYRFGYNAQGQIQAITRVRSRIHLIADDEYANEVKIDVYSTTGQLLISWMNTSRGHRIVVEPFE